MSLHPAVLPDLKLPSHLKNTPEDLTRQEKEQIRTDALNQLACIDPILPHILDVKVVRNQRRNFINLRVRRDYSTLIFHSPAESGVTWCFFISDKLEPFITITALSQDEGKLSKLSSAQVVELEEALQQFKKRFGIVGESYHYTSLEERQETDQFVRETSVDMRSKSHSSHFHLKMRIATEMYKDKFPVLKLMNFDELRRTVDHIMHNYSRETLSWEQVKPLIEKDAQPPSH
eukprot:gene5837-9040_t